MYFTNNENIYVIYGGTILEIHKNCLSQAVSSILYSVMFQIEA